MSEMPETPVEPQDEVPQDDKIIAQRLNQSLVVFAGMAVIVAIAIYVGTRPKQPREEVSTPFAPPQVRAVKEVAVPEVHFSDITQAAGIHFQHVTGATGQKLLPETMGGGAAFFDYDNDGDQDLLFANSSHWSWDKATGPQPTMELYRNNGKGQFEDVTAEAGLNVSFYGMGIACGDYDGDGWTDVFFSAVGKNHLFRNVQGKFSDVTADAGVSGSEQEWSTSSTFWDYDRDGDLDLFVGNYVRWSREIDLAQDFRLVGVGRAYGPPTSFEGTFPYLYRNEGNGKFTDVTKAAGLQVVNPATGLPMAKTMGVVPVDVDGDGYLDLLLANDTVQNMLYLNQRDGTFREIGNESGVAFDSAGNARGAMGADAAKFRNDSTLGISIGNFANEMTALYTARDNQPFFTDDAIATGLGPPTRGELTFGLFFFDCDLDGRLDLLAGNGHLEHEINKVQRGQQYEQLPHLLWNAGSDQKSEFISLPAEKCGSGFTAPLVGRGTAYADIDGDGDLDVVIVANGGSARLLRNDQDTKHHWLRVKLVGQGKNHEAIGTRVVLQVGKTFIERAVMPTRSYCSQSELPVTFGLGDSTDVGNLTIYWPDGSTQVVPVEKIDTLMQVEQTKSEK